MLTDVVSPPVRASVVHAFTRSSTLLIARAAEQQVVRGAASMRFGKCGASEDQGRKRLTAERVLLYSVSTVFATPPSLKIAALAPSAFRWNRWRWRTRPLIARRETGVLPDALCGGGHSPSKDGRSSERPMGGGVARTKEIIACAADPLSRRTARPPSFILPRKGGGNPAERSSRNSRATCPRHARAAALTTIARICLRPKRCLRSRRNDVRLKILPAPDLVCSFGAR